MSDEKTQVESGPPPRRSLALTILPSSTKVDQLRQEIAAGVDESVKASAGPSASYVPHVNRVRWSAGAKAPELLALEEKVVAALRTVFDPEIPVDIYELGLVYDIDVSERKDVHVRMTLTAPGCPVAGSMPAEVERKVEAIPEVRSATVELVWEPQWTKEMMSEVARLELGFL